ncbi:MAG: transglutaminase-like domain-containing protein [Candidatus Micrarchaeota archaeon]
MRIYVLLFLALFVFGCIIPSPPVQKGCYYNNSPCASNEDCIGNTCVLKMGCDYGRPSCPPSMFNCINNTCLLKEGCQYYNPRCDEGYVCANNTCTVDRTYDFTVEKNNSAYYRGYCDKIDAYDLSVSEAAADAIKNHSGSYSINQLFDIYDWVKNNITYQRVHLKGIPYHPSGTLKTKVGDCKSQAVLIASMVKAIGGTSQVVVDPYCEHGYAIVYLGQAGMDMSSFKAAVKEHYGPDVRVSHFTADNSTWVIFDPAGASYPGNTLPECSGNRSVYFVTSCLDCAHQQPPMQYTFNDKCYSTCPSGTVNVTDYTCAPCPEGSDSCNNQCYTCREGYYLGTDCLCHKK